LIYRNLKINVVMICQKILNFSVLTFAGSNSKTVIMFFIEFYEFA